LKLTVINFLFHHYQELPLCTFWWEVYFTCIFQHFLYCYWWRSLIFQCLQQGSQTRDRGAICHLPVKFMWLLQGCCSNYRMLSASVLNNLFYFSAFVSVAVYARFAISQIFTMILQEQPTSTLLQHLLNKGPLCFSKLPSFQITYKYRDFLDHTFKMRIQHRYNRRYK
jgi:hypothetical protein